MVDLCKKFNYKDKISLYFYLLDNGFNAFDAEKFKNSPLSSKFTISEVKEFLEFHKEHSEQSLLQDCIFKTLESKDYYKYGYFNTLFADFMIKKSQTFPENSNYRSVYLFLSEVLQGQFPDVNALNEQSINILCNIIQEMQRMVKFAVDEKEFQRLMISESAEQIPSNSSSSSKQLIEELQSMFKFKKLEEFMNPLGISGNTNEKLMNHILSHINNNNNNNNKEEN